MAKEAEKREDADIEEAEYSGERLRLVKIGALLIEGAAEERLYWMGEGWPSLLTAGIGCLSTRSVAWVLMVERRDAEPLVLDI